MRSVKAKVRLQDRSKVTTLLDTSIEMNVMIRELNENANLSRRQKLKLELISHITHSCSFIVDLYKDMEVAIEGLTIKNTIFVIKTGDYDLVLDQSFLNFVKFNQEYKLYRIFSIIIHSYIY